MRTQHAAAFITLPIELLYEIHLFSTSPTLPQTCKTLHAIFASSPFSYRAQYLIACTESKSTHIRQDAVLTTILRYPVCTQDVLEAYFRRRDPRDMQMTALDLPRRLFRALVPRESRPCPRSPSDNDSSRASRTTHMPVDPAGWSDSDPPLPFLRYLYTYPHLRAPNANAHGGYALTKAVKVGFVPLVRFLLDHGATPAWKGNLSVLIAIHRRDLELVRMLVERMDMDTSPSRKKSTRKRRKLEDRVEVTPEMLRTAVKYKAQDIVEYLTREKGCVPDMQTLLLMR
ncbi:hypothetical protein JVU11DRAFT_4184 [Chiua virens]|nr:hypothetical protein JVU11DRAFT_4184 [Chiua virens]